MNEREWVQFVVKSLTQPLKEFDETLKIESHKKLPYSNEIIEYGEKEHEYNELKYETDILVYEETSSQKRWIPRVITEVKINKVSTHDAITYSQKAFTHKNVHPYLRYGILVGNRKHFPLPGRLYRHGAHFDFMISWQSFESSPREFERLLTLITEEVKNSRKMEQIILNTRSPDREHYTLLHRPVKLEDISN